MISFCKCLSNRYLQSDLAEMWGLFYMNKKEKIIWRIVVYRFYMY